MKIQIGNEPYLYRPTGLPIEGRLTVFKLNTDVKVKTYTLEGTEFVQAANPVLLHSGLPDDSLFVDIGLYTLRVERYTGPEGQMSVDSPDLYFEIVDQYEVGLDFDPQSSSGNVVDTLEELQDCAVEMKYVTVLWHTTEGDCVPRQYIWDAQSQDTIDGGYVVGSNKSDTGRWILLWGDEIIPASVYGVTPTNEGNILMALSYPDTVGSFFLKTAPCVRFQPGNYTIDTGFSTSKELCFDAGTKFTAATFTCPRIRVFGGSSAYIADFVFTDKSFEAHSSWFRSLGAFWACGAHTLVVDPENYFASTLIRTNIQVTGAIIQGRTRLPATYGTNSSLVLNGCVILGERLFSPSLDILHFMGMEFKQEWMTATNYAQYDFGPTNEGHRLQLRSIENNHIYLKNFPASPNTYLKAILADGKVSLDGEGKTFTAGLATNTQLTEIRNVQYEGYVSDSVCAVWENVSITGTLTFTGAMRTVSMKGCSFALSGDTLALSNLGLTDCDVRSGGNFCPSYTAISVNGGTFAAAVVLSDNAKQTRAKNKALSFTNCVLNPRDNPFWVNVITMRGCTSNAHVYLVPYSENGSFGMEGTFVDNHFVQGALIECNVKDMAAEYMVYNVLAALTFVGNRFDQEDPRGIVMPFVTQEFDFNRTFLASGSGAASVYKDNIGKCPLETPSKLFFASSMVGSQIVAGGLHYLPPSTYAQRVWNLSTLTVWKPGLLGIQFEPSGDSWNPINGRDARAHYGELLHVTRVLQSDAANDQFSCVHAWSDIDGFSDDLEVFYP